MATPDSHITQWKHNRAFLALIPPAYSDWLVTVAFYVALHAVDALLAHDMVQRVTSHGARNDVLMRTNRYDAIRKAYMPLYDLARTIRYLADPAQWVPASEIENNVLKRYLYPLEHSVQKLMGVDLALAPVILARGEAGKEMPPTGGQPGAAQQP